MGKITVETCEIEGLKVITPTVFGDDRGYFMETYNYNDFAAAGIDVKFVQDNQSASKKGVLRGLHFQINYPQDKLVRVVNGEVFDGDVPQSTFVMEIADDPQAVGGLTGHFKAVFGFHPIHNV